MIADRLSLFQNSVFGKISSLAKEFGAVNLGQGFPDFNGPDWLQDLVTKKMREGHNQYAPFSGSSLLREQIAHYYKRFYSLDFDPENEVTVTVGATEAIYLVIMGLINPGDEVIVLEPFYDSYVASIKMAGGIPVPVTLHTPDFYLDTQEFKSAITSRTKLVILNNPHNPSGKVWTKEELIFVSEIAQKHNLLVLSDEVYEFLTFDKAIHIPTATIPGMKERTITISSAGKTFGMTGWKIGWICATPEISRACRLIHQYVTFSVSTPMQEAVAEALVRLEDYLPGFQNDYCSKRDLFYQGLVDLGFNFKKPLGTYFMMVPIHDKTSSKDVDYALELIKTRKVATVPPSAFYLKSNEGDRYLRFCFSKTNETLLLALDRLKGL
jgi:aspartate/methionine/tyrosine aminotransferase